MKKMYLIANLLFVVCLFYGCASISNLSKITVVKHGNTVSVISFDINKLKYDENLLGYTYNNKIILDTVGKKIRDKETAINVLQFTYKNRGKTTKDKIIGGVSLVYMIPTTMLNFGFETTMAIINLPLVPAYKYFSHQFINSVFDNFEKGMALLKENNLKEARIHFIKALNYEHSLIYTSKIYYLIARTYELENNINQAILYYRLFIDYSISLYPAFFKEYNASYLHDSKILKTLFNEAENKINICQR
ncbi:MAG: tetratricopeptide repeat protein [bacterium]|nr:tetratricopeptide repeat protein [bacterium]